MFLCIWVFAHHIAFNNTVCTKKHENRINIPNYRAQIFKIKENVIKRYAYSGAKIFEASAAGRGGGCYVHGNAPDEQKG